MRRKGFTLIEVMVVIIVIGILAAMATAFFKGDNSAQKKCAENLRVISQAIEAYRDANTSYPSDGTIGSGQSLKDALVPGYASADVFKCPADTLVGNDSYSDFYVKRNDYSGMSAFSLGCPRHDGNKSAMNLFFQGQIIKYKTAAVTAGGSALSPGRTVSGMIDFSDGSVADVTIGSVMLIQSFDIGNGKCYSLLKTAAVPTIVDSNVTAGSKYEIITPSAIAGVGGTSFRVEVVSDTITNISTTEGTVVVLERNGMGGKSEVNKGETCEAEKDKKPKKRRSEQT